MNKHKEHMAVSVLTLQRVQRCVWKEGLLPLTNKGRQSWNL